MVQQSTNDDRDGENENAPCLCLSRYSDEKISEKEWCLLFRSFLTHAFSSGSSSSSPLQERWCQQQWCCPFEICPPYIFYHWLGEFLGMIFTTKISITLLKSFQFSHTQRYSYQANKLENWTANHLPTLCYHDAMHATGMISMLNIFWWIMLSS